MTRTSSLNVFEVIKHSEQLLAEVLWALGTTHRLGNLSPPTFHLRYHRHMNRVEE
jgi:hypothetical protein